MNQYATRVKKLARKFEETQAKWSEYGAYDTEPDFLFQKALRKALEEKDVHVPRTAEHWQLYIGDMDCSKAAMEMTETCLAVVHAIIDAPEDSMSDVLEVVDGICWRI